MLLSKVTIQGFKSFAKKTELVFDGGITAIVGPNGCGKTNIVDAIRWALGEQRPSILRTDRMENVIFGGTTSSRPLGMAEVSITFDNSHHLLPIDYQEVVVTRRLYRSGESEYLLNKTPVRLKDITDLFMDTGIGADAYSVIELKMVEDILSDKAEDRRKLLEEAAGVTKYKHRLKAALRKLDATQADLLRVNDIIQEVERNVRSLKRQVQKARQYQELHDTIRSLDLRRSAVLYARIQEQMVPLRETIADLSRRKDGRTTTIAHEEADLEALRLELAEREKNLLEFQATLSEIIERVHRREGDIRVGRERIASLSNRVERYTREIEELSRRLSEQKNHLEVARHEREALQVRITSTQRLFQNKKKELEVFQQGLNLRRLELNTKKREIIECLEALNRLAAEESGFRTRIDNSRGRLERIDEEDRFHQQALSDAEGRIASLDARLQVLAGQIHELKARRETLVAEEERQRRTIESLKERIYKDQGEIDLLKGRLAFLSNVLENLEGLSDGTKWLIKERVPGLIGVLADVIGVDPRHRPAIEAGLGEAARYLLFEDTSYALAAIDYLKRRGGGNTTLVALDRVATRKEKRVRPATPPEIPIVGWAEDLVSCEERVRPLFHILLGDLLIVPDRESARRFIETCEGPFRVVTLEGELLTGWGAFQILDPGIEAAGIVGRRQRIEELKAQITRLQETLAQETREREEVEARLASLLHAREALDRQIAQAEETFQASEREKHRAGFEVERAEEGLRRNAEERGRLLAEIEAGREGLEKLRPPMEALGEKRETLEATTIQMQAEVDRLEEEGRLLEEEVHKHNLMLVRLNGEAKALDDDLARAERLIQEIEKTIAERRAEIESAQHEIAAQTQTLGEDETALIQEIQEKERLEAERLTREADYQALRSQLDAKEKEVRAVRREREEVGEQIHTLEMQIAELTHQAGLLVTRIRETYQADLMTVPPEPDLDLEAVERELEETKALLRALGPVNLVALKEYEEQQKRLEFLLKQRDDLLGAEATLKETIQKINHTARTRFLDIFEQVRENFKTLFHRFFQGGDADLRLEEDTDPLEAPIAIMARPPGKQLRDITLLSGGEKALTAISLLFALYMVKPSPFCILDEVDAPLDDANVERFTRVLKEYAQKTQFILVSHNKMTMKAAQALYGVTMEEEGISKLVSVKLRD